MNLINDVVNASFAEVLNLDYISQVAYKLEAIDFFDISNRIVSADKADGEQFYTDLIDRDNQVAYHTKEGSRNYKQNLPLSTRKITQSFYRLALMQSWTESDEEKISILYDKLRGLNNSNNDIIESELSSFKSPRKMLEQILRGADRLCWFGSSNYNKLLNNPALTETEDAGLTTKSNNVETYGVFTHPEIESIVSSSPVSDLEGFLNVLKEQNTLMLQNTNKEVNKIILPADLDTVKVYQLSGESKTLLGHIKDVMPQADIRLSHTMSRHGINACIVCHTDENRNDRMFGCVLSNVKTTPATQYMDSIDQGMYAVCGGFEVKNPDGIKIITGIKG